MELEAGLTGMRKHPPLISLSALLLGLGACSTQTASGGNADSTNAPDNHASAMPLPGSTTVPTGPADASSPADLKVTSDPAAGSTVAGPVNRLMLDFSAPVALGEVTVSGPDGLMPMMLSPAGLQTHFEIPLPGLESGAYTVTWRATLNGAAKSGTFAFTVR